MIFISAVLNRPNFIMKRLKVKSSDLTSDRVNVTKRISAYVADMLQIVLPFCTCAEKRC